MSPPLVDDSQIWIEDSDADSETRDKILTEIGATKESIAADVQTLRSWIKYQHHFPSAVIGDTLLESFLIGCKCSIERAKSKLDAYFTCRAKFPEIFSNRDPLDAEFQRYAEIQPLITLAGRTEDGCRVHATWLEGAEYDVTFWTKRVISQWDVLLRTDPWSAGEIFLLSGTNFSFSHVAKLTPHQVSTIFSLAQNVYPMRIKGIWFFNAPPACDFLVNKILKPVMSKKLSERIQVFAGDNILLQHFSTKLLPEDYGGEADKLAIVNEKWLKRICKYRDWFLNEGSLTTIEDKRPTGTVDSFGSVAGSFKKLQID